MNDFLIKIFELLIAILALFGGSVLIKKISLKIQNNKSDSISGGVNNNGEIGRMVINNYNMIPANPGIGNTSTLFDNQDDEKVKYITRDFYQEGFSQLNISQEDLVKFSNLLHTLTTSRLDSLGRKKFPEKGVSNDHHRRLQGSIFTFGAKGLNQDWKSQISSSIRETLDLFSEDKDCFKKEYLKLFKKEFNAQDEEFVNAISETLRIRYFYNYFSGITHDQLDRTVHAFRTLESEITDNKEAITDESFEKIFLKFFSTAKKLIDFKDKHGTN